MEQLRGVARPHLGRATTRRLDRTRSRAGLTLIELLVAMALMTVLTGVIVFIFQQAQSIYAHVVAKVEVYQYARSAFDQMERDLANVVTSADMDFYQDLNKNGHYDPGEEINPGTGIDGTEESVLNSGPASLQQNKIPYNYHYGVTLRAPKWYAEKADPTKLHVHDSIYFKTITQFQGQTSSALVEYAIVDMDKERPKLQKRTWIVTGMDSSQTPPRVLINQPPIGPNQPGSTKPIVQDLCLYVTDVSFQFFVKNKRKGNSKGEMFSPGTFYSAEELVSARADPVTKLPPFPPFYNYWNGLPSQAIPNPPGQQSYMVMCFYDPSHQGGNDHGSFGALDGGKLHTDAWFGFPMLSAGDKMYVFQQAASATGGGTPPPAVPANDYTIKGFPPNGTATPSNQYFVQFDERISVGAPNFQDKNYAYRAGWLPPAIRCTLRIKDSKAKELRTISRTFKVLASS